MNKIKLCLILILSLVILFSLNSYVLADGKKKIVIMQYQDFGPDSDAITSFLGGLEELEYTDKVEVEKFNAMQDKKVLAKKIDELKKRKDVSLIFSLGTIATREVIKGINDISIIFTGVGAPERSGIITNSNWKSSGANYTGVETPNYVSLGIQLIHNLIDFKTLGMIGISTAPSHKGAIQQVSNLSKELGVNLVHEYFDIRDKDGEKLNSTQVKENIKDALDKVLPKVDAFYVVTSKTFENNFDVFKELFLKYKVISVGDPIYIEKGIVMGIGRDYKVFGGQAAEYAVKILEGTKPSTLPMDIGKKLTIELNLNAAFAAGYSPSVDVLGAADKIYE